MSEVGLVLEMALQSHRDGAFEDAAAMYRQVLTLEPDQPDALALLGTLLAQTGDATGAESLLLQALTREPDLPVALTNLADLYQKSGRTDAAIHLMERAVALVPDDPAVLGNAAFLFWQVGRAGDAKAAADRALALDPRLTQALNVRALCALADGDTAMAARALDDALSIDPGYVEALVNKSRVCQAEQDLEGALGALIRAAEQRPDSPVLWLLIADCLTQFGRYADAHGVFAHARSLDPKDPDILRAWAGMLLRSGNPEAAEQCTQEGLLQIADDAGLLALQGQARISMGELVSGVRSLQKAVAADPGFWPGRDLLAQHLLGSLGDGAAFRAECAELARQCPGTALHSAFLRSLAADPMAETDRLAAAYREFGVLFPPRVVPTPPLVAASATRLRVGVVCTDWQSAAARFVLAPLLARQEELDCEIRVFDLSAPATPPGASARADAEADATDDVTLSWRCPAGGLTDEALAALIAAAGVDVVLDLAGHAPGAVPTVFRYRMAPSQGGWIGPGIDWENALPELDFVIADSQVVLPEEASLLRGQFLPLPQGLAFEGGLDATPVSPLPADRAGHVTLGYRGDLALVGPEGIAAWAAIMRAVPDSRLHVVAPQLAYADSRARIFALLGGAGVEARRLTLSSPAEAEGRGRFYDGVDIALGSFPADGGTEAAEAAWMGVPMVAIAADRPAGRHGAAILRAAGFSDLIAATPEEGVAKTVALAADPVALARWRASARQQMQASPLCDGARYARTVVQTLRMITGRTTVGEAGHG